MKKNWGKKVTFSCSVVVCTVSLNCFQAWNSIRIKSSKCIYMYTLYIRKTQPNEGLARSDKRSNSPGTSSEAAKLVKLFCSRYQFTLHSDVPTSSFPSVITSLHRKLADTFPCFKAGFFLPLSFKKIAVIEGSCTKEHRNAKILSDIHFLLTKW